MRSGRAAAAALIAGLLLLALAPPIDAADPVAAPIEGGRAASPAFPAAPAAPPILFTGQRCPPAPRSPVLSVSLPQPQRDPCIWPPEGSGPPVAGRPHVWPYDGEYVDPAKDIDRIRRILPSAFERALDKALNKCIEGQASLELLPFEIIGDTIQNAARQFIRSHNFDRYRERTKNVPRWEDRIVGDPNPNLRLP